MMNVSAMVRIQGRRTARTIEALHQLQCRGDKQSLCCRSRKLGLRLTVLGSLGRSACASTLATYERCPRAKDIGPGIHLCYIDHA